MYIFGVTSQVSEVPQLSQTQLPWLFSVLSLPLPTHHPWLFRVQEVPVPDARGCN